MSCSCRVLYVKSCKKCQYKCWFFIKTFTSTQYSVVHYNQDISDMQLLNNLTGTDVPIMTAVMGTQREELQSAIITLNEPNAVYYSGQLIKGNLNFELNKPLHYIGKYCYIFIHLVCA